MIITADAALQSIPKDCIAYPRLEEFYRSLFMACNYTGFGAILISITKHLRSWGINVHIQCIIAYTSGGLVFPWFLRSVYDNPQKSLKKYLLRRIICIDISSFEAQYFMVCTVTILGYLAEFLPLTFMQYLSGCSAEHSEKDVWGYSPLGGDPNCPLRSLSNFAVAGMIFLPHLIIGGVMILICDRLKILENTSVDPKRLKLPHILCMGIFVFFVYRIESRLEDPGEWSYGQCFAMIMLKWGHSSQCLGDLDSF
jgi:hypothetical protein